MLVASLSLAATPSRAQTTPSTAQTATPPPLSDGQMLEAALTQRAELPDALEVGKPLTLHLDISHPADALVQPPSDSGSTRWVLSNTSITSPPGEAAATITRDGDTYYFCSNSCHDQFVAELTAVPNPHGHHSHH